MKVALVHDYIKEFGGAERVLKVLSGIYPQAPIYTAFAVRGSTAWKEFGDKEIKESFLAPVLKLGKLYSPLRFLTPLVWGNMDLSEYDLVITSASWYIARGFKTSPKTKVVCYCHTPPRWLYGYETSVGFTKYWPVKVYSAAVGHFMRIYDFKSAQTIKYWIANSKNVAERIKKFYRKNSVVIYPPVDFEKISKINKKKSPAEERSYFLMVSRLVGAKGLEEAVGAFRNSKYNIKIAGESAGFSDVAERLKKLSGGHIELLGRVPDTMLYDLYAGARAFICLARQEDFGMTPVEAMATGTPVIAYNGGGYKESIIDGKTGILIDEISTKSVLSAINRLEKTPINSADCIAQAKRFSKERFVRSFKDFVSDII